MWRRFGRSVFATMAASAIPGMIPQIGALLPPPWNMAIIPALMAASKGIRESYQAENKPAPWWAGIF